MNDESQAAPLDAPADSRARSGPPSAGAASGSHEPPSRATLLIGCLIFLLLGAATLTYLNWPAIGSPTRYNGDVQQSPHWVAYHGDAFPADDLLVRYSTYNETPLQNAIYWVGTLVLDLVPLNKLVGTVFFAATAALFFLLVSLTSGVRAGALAGLFCLIFPRVAYETSGGFSKAWAVGLVLLAVHVVETRRWPMLLWLMPFAALAYPVTPVLIGGIALTALLMELPRSPPEAFRALKHLTGGSTLALMPLLYKYFSPPANIGEMITPIMMKEMWARREFGDVTMPLYEDVLYYVEDHGFFIYSTVLLLMLLAKRGLVWKRSWTALVVASTVFYGLSYLVIPSLYLPDRYTRYSVAILLVLWHAHNWNRVLEAFRRPWSFALAATVLVGLTVVSFGDTFRPGNGGERLNRWNDRSRVAAVSRAVASLPGRVLVAGHPYDMGDVMLQSGRPVLAIHRLFHPWFSGYRDAVQARIQDTLTATYAHDVGRVNRLAERYGVTHLVVDKDRFDPRRTRNGRVYKPQFARAVHRLTRGDPDYVLRPPPPDAVVYEDRDFWLVRLPLREPAGSGNVPGRPVADPSRQRQR